MKLPLSILQVENSAEDAALIEQVLSDAGYEVSCGRVQSGPEMRAALLRRSWQVVIADDDVPHFGPATALKTLQESGLDVPLIVVSGSKGEEKAVRMIKAGAQDYLTKDNLRRLAAAVGRELKEAEVRRQRRQVELAQRNRKDQLARAAATVPGMLFSFRLWPDGSTALPYVSSFVDEGLALDPQAVLNDASAALALIHPDDIGRIQSSIQESAAKMTPWREEFRVRHVSKGEIWVEGHSVPQREEDGSILWHGFIQDVSARRRSDEALRESERLLRLVMDLVPHSVFAKDQDGKRLFVNKACAKANGMTPEQMAGLRDSEFIADRAQAEAFMRDDREVIATGRPKIIPEEELTDANGQTRILQTIKVPFAAPGTGAPAILGVAVDITELKRTEAALRESERRFRSLMETVQLATVMVDAHGRILFCNDYLLRLTGWSRDEVALKDWFTMFVPPEEQIQVRHAAASMIRDGTNSHLESEIVTRHGAKRLIAWNNTILRTGSGAVVGVASIGEDITEQRAGEKALRMSEERFRAVVESAPDGICVETEGKFVYVNGPAARLFGAQGPEELLNQPVLPRVHPEDREKVAHRMRRVNEDREPVQLARGRYLRLDGSVFDVESIGVPFEYDRKPGALVFFRDITEGKRLEDQFRQAQKMEGIGQLAGGIAHDFNNILTAVMMQLELLQLHPQRDPELRDGLKELMAQAQRAASLTRQLLMFSRRSVMQLAALDLNEVVENLLKMLRRLIGEHIKLDWHGGSSLSQVVADAGMIEQLLMNLVVNARDAMPKGGRLIIATEALELTAEQVRNEPQARAGRFVRLSVTDTGCGMEPAVLGRIFEPFFTTKEAGKGTGLGLATVYGIVSQHQGWITVESQAGQGTTFRVYFPAASSTSELASALPVESVQGGSETILLVEDDPPVRKTISTFLRRWGYKVFEAGDGMAAFDLWQEHHEEVQLVFTDMIMPEGMTGLELAERLRGAKPDLRVIISSGYSTELAHHGTSIIPGVKYVPKPSPPHVLARAVRQSLDSKGA